MKNIKIFLTLLGFLTTYSANAQTCTTNSGTSYFFTLCSGAAPFNDPDDYTIKVKNNQVIVINGDVTINGTLTINLVGSTSKVLIQSPYTLHAGNIVFTGSATGKVFEVEGPDGKLVVDGTLDFGGNTIEIDGTGTINAGTITGGGNTTCSGVSTCPTINATTCADPSGLCTEPGTVTPVELIFFSGEESNEGVVLNWATASEENFDYFEVQRAYQGTDFEILDEINGAGNSFTKKNYSFVDKYPELGHNYYRLKSVDLDGTYEYSEVILVRFTSGIDSQISPNPSTGKISIKTNLQASDNLTFVITNHMGNIVYQGILSEYNTQIDLSNLVKGVYIIRLSDFQLVKPQRIILR